MNYNNFEDINKKLGLRIATYREIKGLTQTELAQKMGYKDRSSITKIESGAVRLPVKKLQQFADVLGVDVEVFFDAFEEHDFSHLKNNASAIVSEMESMQNILRMLSAMDAKKLSQIESIIKTFVEE